MDKKSARLRRAKRARSKMKELKVYRLSIHRTPRHIYAQVISPENQVVATASTLDKALRSEIGYGGNKAAASAVGKAIAQRALEKGVSEVAFDRSGFKYHGRVEALAQAAREAGLKF